MTVKSMIPEAGDQDASSGPCARRRTSRTTSWPSAVSRSMRAVPMKPEAPAMRIRTSGELGFDRDRDGEGLRDGAVLLGVVGEALALLLGDAGDARAHEQVAAEHASPRLERHGRGGL